MILYTVFITIEDISITKAAKETKSIKTSQTMRVQINVQWYYNIHGEDQQVWQERG